MKKYLWCVISILIFSCTKVNTKISPPKIIPSTDTTSFSYTISIGYKNSSVNNNVSDYTTLDTVSGNYFYNGDSLQQLYEYPACFAKSILDTITGKPYLELMFFDRSTYYFDYTKGLGSWIAFDIIPQTSNTVNISFTIDSINRLPQCEVYQNGFPYIGFPTNISLQYTQSDKYLSGKFQINFTNLTSSENQTVNIQGVFKNLVCPSH